MSILKIYFDRLDVLGSMAALTVSLIGTMSALGLQPPVKESGNLVSMENAMKNLNAELSDWDFERVLSEANKKWNRELDKIAIATESEDDRKKFYTALYHTMITPSLFNDSNGDYCGTDKIVYGR